MSEIIPQDIEPNMGPVESYDVIEQYESATRARVAKNTLALTIATAAIFNVGFDATIYELGAHSVTNPADNQYELTGTVVGAFPTHPTVTVTDALRDTYPDEPKPYHYPDMVSSYIDYDQTTDGAVVYKYEGLDTISFARPSAEVNNGIHDAWSIAELQDAIDPYYDSLGMKLYLSDDGPHTKDDGYGTFTDEQLPFAKYVVSNINEAVSHTPRELLAFADVKDIYVPYVSKSEGQPILPSAGYALNDNGRRGIMVVAGDHEQDYTITGVVDHEIGHHIRDRLNEETLRGLDAAIGAENPDWFVYKDSLTTHAAITWQGNNYAIAEQSGVSTDYGFTNRAEEGAVTYAESQSYGGVPSPSDTRFPIGTPGYDKKIIMIDSIDKFVPGYKQYKIGNDTLMKYPPQWTPNKVTPKMQEHMGDKLVEMYAPANYKPEDSQFIDPTQSIGD